MINRHLDPYGYMIPEIFPTGDEPYDPNLPLHIDDPCEFWVDGQDASTFDLTGILVNQWDDKSGFDRHVLNAAADATRPTYDINTGRVTFTAANNTFLQSAAFASALTQPNTVFVVYKISGSLITGAAFSGITNSAKRNQFGHVGSNFYILTNVLLTDGATDANDNIHVGEFNGLASNYWINGALKISGNVGAGTLDGITLGKNNTSTVYADVEIMEVIVYNSDISDTDRDVITAYLADKWGITSTTNNKGFVLYY